MPWQDALWPYLPTLMRLGLALGLGMFTGLERQRRGKEAGLRTFAIAALLGCLASLLGDAYALLALALLGFLWPRGLTGLLAAGTALMWLLHTRLAGLPLWRWRVPRAERRVSTPEPPLGTLLPSAAPEGRHVCGRP